MDPSEGNGRCMESGYSEDYAANGSCQSLSYRDKVSLPRSLAHQANGYRRKTLLSHGNVVAVTDQSLLQRWKSWRDGRHADYACTNDLRHYCSRERSVSIPTSCWWEQFTDLLCSGVASIAIRSLAHAGEVITDRNQQEEVIRIFEKINKETGWRIGFVYKELKEKWGWAEEPSPENPRSLSRAEPSQPTADRSTDHS